MKLREWDWDLANAHGADGHVEIDYPEAPIQNFLNWMRSSKAWHENVEMVHRKLQLLESKLAEHRQAVKEAAALTAKNVAMTSEVAPERRTAARAARES